MANIKPWMTSDDLVRSIKIKISLPTSQNTLSVDDILEFVNEELMISQVPSILSFSEEYFVYQIDVPVVYGQKKYPIPDRAIGMKFRDIFLKDEQGNLLEMTRISPDDQDYFGSNSASYSTRDERKYHIQGNDVVLASDAFTLPRTLVFSIYLRPNQLVRTSRVANVISFLKKIEIENAFLNQGDSLTINKTKFRFIENTVGGSISSHTVSSSATIITSASHNLVTGDGITISGSSSSPSLNGSYVVTVIDSNTFSIPKAVATSSTTGTWTSYNQVLIGANSSASALNLSNSITSSGIATSSVSTSTLTISYSDVSLTYSTSDANAIIISTKQGVGFQSIPTTDTNESGVISPLFVAGSAVDFLQTKPGHRMRKFDIVMPSITNSTTLFFNSEDVPFDLVVGDYMCLANECIIPQIPPDLHSGLAERTCARILASQGDLEGLQVAQGKIAEIMKAEGQLIDSRVSGSEIKINTRHTMLGYQKRGFGRKRY